MGKLKINLEISDRDKKLLAGLLAALIFAAAFMFGYKNLTAMAEQYDKEATTLESKKKDLVEKNNNKEKYESDLKTYNDNYNLICSNYSNITGQDAVLDFLIRTEKITGSWLKNVTVSDPSLIYTFGKIASTNPSNQGSKVYTTDMKGFKTSVTLSYEATYDQLKEYINYVNNYYSKNTIDSIAMAYNEVTKVLTGTMTVSLYSITGSQRKYTAPAFDLPSGTDNIFSSNVFVASAVKSPDSTGEYILSDYDYFMMLNPSTADVDSCIIGQKNDASKASILSKNSNDVSDVTIKFAGKAGNYTVQYKIGDTTYPAKNYEKGQTFTPGNTLDLLIMSSARISNTDKSGINLTLVNESDLTLNIKACNDDATNPRIKYASKTGSIKIFQ